LVNPQSLNRKGRLRSIYLLPGSSLLPTLDVGVPAIPLGEGLHVVFVWGALP
ncbi:MAG: hypothetical protein K0Q84_2175, partial [Arthrobacter sp.]|nr:hypothetical protein [Arthrobacter sp.]